MLMRPEDRLHLIAESVRTTGAFNEGVLDVVVNVASTLAGAAMHGADKGIDMILGKSKKRRVKGKPGIAGKPKKAPREDAQALVRAAAQRTGVRYG